LLLLQLVIVIPGAARNLLNEGKEKWAFETDVFSNGYKIFLFLRRP